VESEGFWEVVARSLRHPRFVAMLGMGPASAVVIAGLRSVGLVAPSPFWLIPVILVLGQITTTFTDLAWTTWPTRPWLHVKIASQAIVVTATIYATGWGPGLSVGLLLVGQESLATVGSGALRAVMGWNLSCLAVGQLFLALGWAPSLLPVPEVHGLALLMAIGIAFSYRSLTGALAEKEEASALIESRERRFRALVQSSHELVFVVDGTAAVTYASPSCLEILGHEPGALLGGESRQHVHEDDLEALRTAVRSAGEIGGTSPEFWMRVRGSDGAWRWLEGIARNLLDDPAVGGMVINARDVTERRTRMEQHAALAALDRYALQATSVEALSETAAESITRLAGARSCRIVGCTPNGLEDELIVAASLSGPGEHASPHGEPVTRRVPIGDPAQPLGQIEVSTTHAPTHDEDRFVESIASILLSSILRRRAEDAMRHQAMHDPLTGLPNRTLFNDRLEQALHRRARVGGYVAVLIVDLDGFKNVNDSLGHQAGDALLNGVADRFRSALRDVDTIARLGGDEFAILVDDLDAPGLARQVAQRVLDSLVAAVELSDRNVAIGASVGIAVADRPDTDSNGLLDDADAAMYRAKRAGKGCYREFEASMHAAAVERMDLEQALRSAIADQTLTVHYQPVVDTTSGVVVSFEALARWLHPTRGHIKPDTFIPLAEELGLIVEIGRLVLFEACRQARVWHGAFPDLRPAIAVNVSVRQLVDPNFVADVAEALARAGIHAATLTLEITESVLANDSGRVIGVLNELRSTGVRIAIDDFGTGYSSFATLAELPIDILKIDKRFIDNLLRDYEGRGIVSAIMQLSQTLQLETIAEGVEQPEQRHGLEQLGCTRIQGYLYAQPMSAGETHEYIEHHVTSLAAIGGQ
jgi:diguanylate cyclase (GGDEF)-like protein/PAS domain S-box-containing protein